MRRALNGTSIGAADPTIQGFAHDININRGEANHFKVNTDATDYRIDIYRLGYYASMAARLASASVGRAKTTC